MIRITCINCGKKYRVKEKLEGETLKCPNCGMKLEATEDNQQDEIDDDQLRAELMKLAGTKRQDQTESASSQSRSKKSSEPEDKRKSKRKKKRPTTSSSTEEQDHETTHRSEGTESDSHVELEQPRKSRTFLTVSLIMLLILGLGAGFAYVQYQSYQKEQKHNKIEDIKAIQQVLETAERKTDPCQRGEAIASWRRVQKLARQYERSYGDGRFVDAISKATNKIQKLQTAQKNRNSTMQQMKRLLQQSQRAIGNKNYQLASNQLNKATEMGKTLPCQNEQVKTLLTEIGEKLDTPSVKYGSKGWVKHNGEWMPEAKKEKLVQEAKTEKMQEQGLVEYNGQWMKPEQKEKLVEAKKEKRKRALRIAALRQKVQKQLENQTPTVQFGSAIKPLRWSTENWANPCQLELITLEPTKQDYVACHLKKGNKNKWVVSLSQPCSIQGYKKLKLDIVSVDKLRLAIGIWTNPGYKLHEGQPKTIKTGGNGQTVTFDLTGKHFKSKKSKWRYKTAIKDRNNVYKISLFFYNQVDHPVHFRNMRIVRPQNDNKE